MVSCYLILLLSFQGCGVYLFEMHLFKHLHCLNLNRELTFIHESILMFFAHDMNVVNFVSIIFLVTSFKQLWIVPHVFYVLNSIMCMGIIS